MSKEKTPLKHAKFIIAWAQGDQLEFRNGANAAWYPVLEDHHWRDETEYRIKPSAPETRMTDFELEKIWESVPGSYKYTYRAIANAAIARALADGDVVLP